MHIYIKTEKHPHVSHVPHLKYFNILEMYSPVSADRMP